MLNMKTLMPFDEFFLYDDPNSLANIMLLMGFDKFEFQSFQKYLYDQLQIIPGMKIKIY